MHRFETFAFRITVTLKFGLWYPQGHWK